MKEYNCLSIDGPYLWLKQWSGEPLSGYIGETPETFIENIPADQVVPLHSELRAKEALEKMLIYILDIDTPILKDLTIPQRAWFYNHAVYQSEKSLRRTAAKHLIPSVIINNGLPETKYDRSDFMYKLEKWTSLNGPDNIDISTDPENSNDNEHNKMRLVAILEQAKQVDLTTVAVEYDIENLQQLLYLEVLDMIENNVMIRKCHRCGKYFVVTNRKTF